MNAKHLSPQVGLNPIIILSFFWGFCFFYLNGHAVFNDYDTAWHIAAGDLIRKLGYIPKTDSWSFTAGETTWYNISWLWDIMLSLIVQYLGLKSLYYFNALLYALILSTLAYNLTIRNYSLSAIAITIFITTFVLAYHACARPYTYSFLMMVVFHSYLYQYTLKKKIVYLMILPLLMVSWVNIHGGFIGGFILIGAYGLAAIINKNWRDMRWLMFTGIACILCALINPYSINIYHAITSTTQSNFTSHIDEWQKFKFGQDWTATLYLLAFFMTFNIKEKSINIADKVIALFWLLAALINIRNIPIFVLCSAPYFARNLITSGLLRPLPDINTAKLRFYSKLSVSTLVIIMLLPSVSDLIVRKDIVNIRRLPSNAVKFIQDNYPNTKFLNEYGLGAYLINLTQGALPVFVDGRAGTAYSEKLLSDYLYLASTFPSLNDDVLNYYQIGGVIAYKSKNLNLIFASKPGWKQVFVDNSVTVYIKEEDGGDERNRTADNLLAKQALYQLSYIPIQ